MNIVVEEIWTTPNSTVSLLFVDQRPIGFILEDGYRDIKVPGETRIPPGRYRVVPSIHGEKFASYSRRFGHKFSIYVIEVPGFSGIMFHIGNTVKDTRGCMLTAGGIELKDRDFVGTNSTVVYKLLYNLMAAALERKEEIWVDVIRREVIDDPEDVKG